MTAGAITIYGDDRSGNCLKVRYVAERLGIPYRWIAIDVVEGETRTPQFLAMNPAGQAPTVLLADGRPLAQSNAIMLHLAEGWNLVPTDPYERAQLYQWLFWEQYSHEPVIAVRRFHKHFLGRPDDAIDPGLLPKGQSVLALMDRHLAERDYFVGGALSLADIALVAYTRLAPEGGFDLEPTRDLVRWVARVERDLGITT